MFVRGKLFHPLESDSRKKLERPAELKELSVFLNYTPEQQQKNVGLG